LAAVRLLKSSGMVSMGLRRSALEPPERLKPPKEDSVDIRRVADLNMEQALEGDKYPSPQAWEDEVLYFLLVDRFAQGREEGYPLTTPEGTTVPAYDPDVDNGNAVTTPEDAAQWRDAGRGWVGGTLAGIRSKLAYLSELGVTAVWVSPVLKQTKTLEGSTANYHGYATQNFLDVDEHYGTIDDYCQLVQEAHALGIRIVQDVVLNHAGDVFAYEAGDPRWTGQTYPVAGWHDEHHQTVPFTPEAADACWPDGAVFPAELHDPQTFTRKGRIVDWNTAPENDDGDFAVLKDIHHGHGPADAYHPSPALVALTQAYCWWIAKADLDGLRLDTVKHMHNGATRYFTSVVHEFAQLLGKDNFLIVGEVAGGRNEIIDTMELTGLDATLGLLDVKRELTNTLRGWSEPRTFFDMFRNSERFGKQSHTWFRNTVVKPGTDDHDQIGSPMARFCADDDGRSLALAALAFNVTTLGVPAIYYGSEQGLDGSGGRDRDNADRYIREAMFGGQFGAFRSRDRHVFNQDHPLYAELSAILAVRRAEPALRRGRQYLRQISGNGHDFGFPAAIYGGQIRSIIAWSRILYDQEVLCAFNNDTSHTQEAWITVDAGLHHGGGKLECLYHSDHTQSPLVVEERNGCAVRLALPPGAFAIYG
jgi:glycosidase